VATAHLKLYDWRDSAANWAAWLATLAVLGLGQYLLIRGCGYDAAPVAAYGGYFLLYVLLPGVVVLWAVQHRPVSLTLAIALGIPTGFAAEIAAYLGLSALGAKSWFTYVPLLWLVAGGALALSKRQWPVRWWVTGRHAGLALAMSLLFLWTVAIAISQMFAASPLISGLPQRAIFHDWVYLLSRAAAIQSQAWPIEDPSLAGTPLHYHYFMLVHVAAASATTKLELATVLLRLTVVVVGGVMVVQVYALGRYLTRRAWGGVLAAFLAVGAGELSFATTYGESMFLGLFARWLHVSPTFFFGVIFFGALLLVIAQAEAARPVNPLYFCWVALLAAAAAGAKGTVMPVILLALGLWAVWRWHRERRLPVALGTLGAIMAGAFSAVYFAMLSAWGAGEATIEPFRVFHVTQFWKDHFAVWERSLAAWLPAAAATWLAAAACGGIAFLGTAGVRLLGLALLIRPYAAFRSGVAGWLGCALLAGLVLGAGLHLDSYGELYLILLVRPVMAVLAAGFFIRAGSELIAWYRASPTGSLPREPNLPRRESPPHRGAAGERPRLTLPDGRTVGAAPRPGFARRRFQLAFGAMAVVGVAAALGVQTGVSLLRQRDGFREWLRLPPTLKVDADMQALHQAMQWLREHTDRDAVLMANAFTPDNLRQGRGRLVDHTTAGVYYYYSALSHRRLWVEGPSYLTDADRAAERMQAAAAFFYHGQPPPRGPKGASPTYVLLDHSVGDGAAAGLPASARVWACERFEIFRLPASAAKTTLASVP
jgi:hypothetical protein